MTIAHRNLVNAGWAALGASLIVFVLGQVALAPHYGLWHDELYSLWSTDPALGLGESWGRLAGDTNPPLFYILLRIGRIFLDNPHALFLLINGAGMALAASFVVWDSWRAERLAFGLFGAAAFIASGPVFYFVQEGRNYSICISFAFALAWHAALIVGSPTAHKRLIWATALAAAAAFSHVYGGLFAGGVAAGLVGWSFAGKRKDLLVPGLAIGGAAAVVTGIWFAVAASRLSSYNFFEFNMGVLRNAVWYVTQIAIGPSLLVAVLAAVVGFGAMTRPSRPMLVVLGAAAAVFFVLPIIASLKTPMIMGRYYAVGTPLVVVVLVFLARDFLLRGDRPGKIAAGVAAALLLIGTGSGFLRAFTLMENDGDWNGAPIVAALAQSCPAGSIHVLSVQDKPELFAISARMPVDRFVNMDKASPVKASEAPCPVLAWVEHGTPQGYGPDAPDSKLLALARIEAADNEAQVIRTNNGFVVLQAGVALPANLKR